MGKKTKVGKSRLDKFYHLAKEQGYRARSAFKLIQLNKKYNFLASSRAVLDLCAAPGGWLQVCSKYMPLSSLIIGVDLFAIKPIRNCVTLKQDITTTACRAAIKKELKTWKLDVVLHDGAPNVGAAWAHDAYGQAELVLHALKLGVEFLNQGGWFVTKVFRSRDYNSLLFVFNQLFKKVEATKPSSSRNTSAEIFVVCQGFLAPKKIDPRLLDPKFVFAETDTPVAQNALLSKAKRNREGYDEEMGIGLYRTCDAFDFVMSEKPVELISTRNSIVFSDKSEFLKNDPSTDEDIVEAFKDLQVLGKAELKGLLKWRLKMRKNYVKEEEEKEEKPLDTEAVAEKTVAEELEELSEYARLKAKRKKRKEREQVAKYQRRVTLGLENSAQGFADVALSADDALLFDAARIKDKAAQLASAPDSTAIEESESESAGESEGGSESGSESESDAAEARLEALIDEQYQQYVERNMTREAKAARAAQAKRKKPKDEMVSVDEALADVQQEMGRTAPVAESGSDSDSGWSDMSESEEEGEGEGEEEDAPVAPAFKRPRLAAAGASEKVSSRTAMFFANPLFGEDDAEELSDDEAPPSRRRPNGEEDEETLFENAPAESSEEGSESDNESASDEDEEGKDDLEIVPKSNDFENMDPDTHAELLAIGKEMVTSKRKRQDLIDSSYNRYAFHDTGLPEWFTADENKHNKPQMPVTKAQIEAMKSRFTKLNARPIQKIAEARLRKKMKAFKKIESMRKKAEGLMENEDISVKSKMKSLEEMTRRAHKKIRRPQRELVVARKGAAQLRSAGKGKKLVDKRLKKDLRAQKASDKRKKRR